MARTPLVSVIMALYNHDDIVGRAIESALAQVTDFPVEIVIGEDCSTDRSREVATEYARKYPDQIHLILNPKNLYIPRNMVSMMTASRGKYLAYLDPDDYWTDPGKLQKQVDFLEKNPEYVCTSHNVRVVLPSGAVTIPSYPELPTGALSLEDMIRENFIPSLSAVYRTTLIGRIPDWYLANPHADWPLWVIIGQDGPFMHFGEVMADYLMHPQSDWSNKGPVHQCDKELEFYRNMRSYLPAEYERLVRACEGVRYERQSRFYQKNGDWKAARKKAILAARAPYWRDNVKDKSRLLLDVYTPGLMKAFRFAKARLHA